MNGKKGEGTLIAILIIVSIMAAKFFVGNILFNLMRELINW